MTPLLVAIVLASPPTPNFCPSGNVPAMPAPDAKCSVTGTLWGDPLDISYGDFHMSRTDIELPSSFGRVAFIRSFTTGKGVWDYPPGAMVGIPKPFGEAASEPFLSWWHNWFSFADVVGADLTLRQRGGRMTKHLACDLGVCAAGANSVDESLEVRSLGGKGFEVAEGSGDVAAYEAKFELPGSPGRVLYFLSRVSNAAGQEIAAVAYGQPRDENGSALQNCPRGTSGWVPYISEVRVPEGPGAGTRLAFSYRLEKSTNACPIASVKVLGSVGAGAQISYTYGQTGKARFGLATAERPANQGNAAEKVETYEWVDSTGKAPPKPPADVGGASGGGAVDATPSPGAIKKACPDPSSTFTVYTGNGKGAQAVTTTVCMDNLGFVRWVETPSEHMQLAFVGSTRQVTVADGLASTTAYKRQVALEPATGMHTARVSSIWSQGCGTNQSCPPPPSSTTALPLSGSEWGAFSGTTTTFRSTSDSAGNKTVRFFEFIGGPGSGGVQRPVLVAEQRGVPSGIAPSSLVNGATPKRDFCVGLECTWSSAERSPETNAVRTVSTSVLSVVHPDETIRTRTTYDGNGRVAAVIQEGYTQFAADSAPLKHFIGTFFLTSRSNGGSDVLGRVVEVHGPCSVSGFSATDCATGVGAPVTQYFYAGAGTGDNSKRLAQVVRFPQGAGTTAVELAEFIDDYSPDGRPTRLRDAAGNETILSYDSAGRVASRTAGGATWSYSYFPNGKLRDIGLPEGNHLVFCYRGAGLNAGAPPQCTGATDERLAWIARAADGQAATWTEAVGLGYDGMGNVRERVVWENTPAGPVRRRAETMTSDFEHRLLGQHLGQDASQPSSANRYDADGLKVALGRAITLPPALCLDPSKSPSAKCDVMTYDTAHRLASVSQTVFESGVAPTPSSPTVSTKVAYDSRGNVCEVGIGGVLNAPCDVRAAGTEGYELDDFGRVLKHWSPNTSGEALGGGANSKGFEAMRYDAQGNLVWSQTAEQAAAGSFYVHLFDTLGRPLFDAHIIPNTANVALNRRVWDVPTAPSNCPAQENLDGRLSSVRFPNGRFFFSYDTQGRLTREIRTSQEEDCSNPAWFNITEYTYTPNGNLASIRYPFGHVVHYTHGVGADSDKVTGILLDVPDPRTGRPRSVPLIENIKWEPFGGVRSYDAVTDTLATTQRVHVEYPRSTDNSGTLAGVLVSNAVAGTAPTVPGDLLRIAYGYSGRGDFVTSEQTCLRDPTCQRARNVSFGFDSLGRLTDAKNASFLTAGGAFIRNGFVLDGRGNRTQLILDDSTPSPLALSSVVGAKTAFPDQVDSEAPTGNSGSLLERSFVHDRDGRVTRMVRPQDSSNEASSAVEFDYVHPLAAANSVIKRVKVGGATYEYLFDWRNHRVEKISPLGGSTRFFFSPADELLTDAQDDRGDGVKIIDDYVWLDGRPLAMLRSRFDIRWQDDGQPDCSRGGELSDATCGTRFVVTDLQSRPVMMLDAAARISGVGEYEPFGRMNRVQQLKETGHPYDAFLDIDWGFHQPPLGLSLLTRVHLPVVDTESCSTHLFDWAQLQTSSGVPLGPPVGGYHAGDVWSSWGASPGPTGGFRLHFHSDNRSLSPDCNPNVQHQYSGVAFSEYEYMRFDPLTPPVFTPLRFPGQYFDAETGLIQNWNRFLYPEGGRYLSPEPMLRKPDYVSARASGGHSMAAYGYAGNNPVNSTDPTGLFVASGACDNWAEAVNIALKKAGCDEAQRGICSSEILRRGGCDICPILRDSQGPYLMFKEWVYGGPPSEISRLAKVSRFDLNAGGPYLFGYVQVRYDACTAGAEWLASVLIHEAMHMCPLQAQAFGDPAAAVMNQTYCGSIIPNESGT